MVYFVVFIAISMCFGNTAHSFTGTFCAHRTRNSYVNVRLWTLLVWVMIHFRRGWVKKGKPSHRQMFIYKLPIGRDYCFDNCMLPKCCPCDSKRCTGRLSDGGQALSEIPGGYELTRTRFLPCVSSASLNCSRLYSYFKDGLKWKSSAFKSGDHAGHAVVPHQPIRRSGKLIFRMIIQWCYNEVERHHALVCSGRSSGGSV